MCLNLKHTICTFKPSRIYEGFVEILTPPMAYMWQGDNHLIEMSNFLKGNLCISTKDV